MADVKTGAPVAVPSVSAKIERGTVTAKGRKGKSADPREYVVFRQNDGTAKTLHSGPDGWEGQGPAQIAADLIVAITHNRAQFFKAITDAYATKMAKEATAKK